jgi:hypothetical protein
MDGDMSMNNRKGIESSTGWGQTMLKRGHTDAKLRQKSRLNRL